MKLTIAEIMRTCNGKLLGGDPQRKSHPSAPTAEKSHPAHFSFRLKANGSMTHVYSAVFAAGAAATLTQNHTAVADDGRPGLP